MAAEPQTEQDIFKIVCRLQFGGRAVEGYRTPGRWRVHRQCPNRAERPGVRRPSGAWENGFSSLGCRAARPWRERAHRVFRRLDLRLLFLPVFLKLRGLEHGLKQVQPVR